MKETGKLNILRSILLLSFILAVVFTVLPNMFRLNGVTFSEVSDKYPNQFTPESMTFYIWFLIGALLLLMTLYMLGVFKGADPKLVRNIGVPFIISNVLIAAWNITWSYDVIWASMILMAGIFFSLSLCYGIVWKTELGAKEKWLVRLPLSVYFGWITIAAVNNLITLFVSIGWLGLSRFSVIWTMVMVAAAALLGAMICIKNRDHLFGLVFIWAYAGILLKNLGIPGGRGFGLSVTAAAALALLVTAVLIAAAGKKRHINR